MGESTVIRQADRYLSSRKIHRANHDLSDDTLLSNAVVRAVAEVTGESPVEMPPLARVTDIDPEALEALFVPGEGDGLPSDTRLSFRYRWCEVVVYGDGTIDIYDAR